MKHSFRSLFALSALAALALCAPANAQVADPTGDTFNTGTLDITSTSGTVSGPTLIFNVTFSGAIAAPSAFAPNSVLGFIDLDTDQNAATGGTAPWGGPVTGGNNWINFFIPPNPGTPSIPGPTIAMGDEFYIDLGSELFHPGLVDVVATSTNLTVGVAPISYASSFFDIFVPIALIGNDYVLDYGVLVGDFQSATDRAPNGAQPLSVPEPGSVALLVGLGMTTVGLLRRRK